MGFFSKAKEVAVESSQYYKLGRQVLGISMLDFLRMSFTDKMRVAKAGQAEYRRRKAEESQRYPKPSRPDGYYSKLRKDGKIDLFFDRNGEITSERPHVHVIHSEPEGKIIFKVTQENGEHTHAEELPIDASGSEVNAMVDRLRREIR